MTVDQQILLHIYATQKVYITRILEMTCALQERLETGEETTGLLSAIVLADAEQLVSSLIDTLKETQPDDIKFGAIHGIPEETLRQWLDDSVYKTFTGSDDENEKE